jgi:hypothetical protein
MKIQIVKFTRYFLPVIFFSLAFGSCKKKAVDNPIGIGKEYQGGTIFFVDNTGQHGMVVTKLNPGFITQGWGCYYADMPETSAAVGAGKSNTAFIVAHCSEPDIYARLCDNLIAGGFSDWYLPSKDELQLIYVNLHQKGIGGFENHPYWSSTEHSATYAWQIDFATGLSDRGAKGNHYQKGLAVRDF